MSLALIWGRTPARVIGADGALPWHLPEDLAHFRATTFGAPVIMGRATWESLPRRPLPGRENLVLSRDPRFEAPGALVVGSLAEAHRHVAPTRAWVIGGAEVYAAALPLADRVVETVVDLDVPGDTWAPELAEAEWALARREPATGWHTAASGVRFRIDTWERVEGRTDRPGPWSGAVVFSP